MASSPPSPCCDSLTLDLSLLDSIQPDYLWSLRVFNDFDGFKRHFPVPSIILFRMVFNVVPTWEVSHSSLIILSFIYSRASPVDAVTVNLN